MIIIFLKYLGRLFRSQKDFNMSEPHTIKFLVITSHNSTSHRAFTTMVKAVWDVELCNVITKNFMVWGSDILKSFWEQNNLPKYFKKDYDHCWITYVTFEKIAKN